MVIVNSLYFVNMCRFSSLSSKAKDNNINKINTYAEKYIKNLSLLVYNNSVLFCIYIYFAYLFMFNVHRMFQLLLGLFN